MVDGILTKLRNPVNHDLWLTGRFSSSVNHPLNESMITIPESEMCDPNDISGGEAEILGTRRKVSAMIAEVVVATSGNS